MTGSKHLVCPHCGAINRVPGDRSAAAALCGTCKKSLFDGHSASVDTATFDRHIAKNDIPVQVNADEQPAISARYGIRSIPTMLLFKNGNLAAQTAGAMDAARIAAWARAQV
jgi:thioredoxin 2